MNFSGRVIFDVPDSDARTNPQVQEAQARRVAYLESDTYLPIEDHGHHQYPSWLWPGSVVDELYDLSVKLVEAFDWPGGFEENLTGTRRWSRTAAWFVLTGERAIEW